MSMASMVTSRMSFDQFYKAVFLSEHTHPLNVSLHVAGTVAGTGLLCVCLFKRRVERRPLALAMVPVLLIVPGLIGHFLFERSEAVGNLRIFRDDFPGYFFLLGNFRMSAELLLGRHSNPFAAMRSL